jgi:DNA polymerase III delta prime subunit
MYRLEKPLLLEGPPGVGKTEAALALASLLDTKLIRLQCYDGLEQREALYEWNYAAQLLHMRAAQTAASAEADVARMERAHALVVDEVHGGARHGETKQRNDARHGFGQPFTVRGRQVRERRAGEFHRRGRFRASRRSTGAVGIHPVQRPAVADT